MVVVMGEVVLLCWSLDCFLSGCGCDDDSGGGIGCCGGGESIAVVGGG